MRYRWSALVIGAIVLSLCFVACGGGEKSAEDRVPDLSDQGFAIIQEGRDQLADPSLDTYKALYQSADGRSAIVLVYVENSVEEAQGQYATFATALANPPPEFFGGDAQQTPSDALSLGDESQAFVTAAPDKNGNLVWTDIYRSGKVVLITQVLANSDSATDLRTTIATKVF